MKRLRNIAGLLMVVSLMLGFLLPQGCIPPLSADNSLTRETPAGKSRLGEKADALFEKISQRLKDRFFDFSKSINQSEHLKFNIKTYLYDAHLRRIFVDFQGSAVFSGNIPLKYGRGDLYLTSDGSLAYDLTLEKIAIKNGAVSFDYRGDLVISLDKLVCDMVEETIQIGGGLAFSQAADSIITFLDFFKADILAKAVAKTFSSFSKETMAVSGAELVSNSLAVQNKKFATLVQGSVKNGTMLTFIALTMIKASASSLAGIGGGSLGAAVGNMIVPGAGGLVGAYVGAKIGSTIAKTVIYELTVDLPIEIAMKKIVHCQADLKESPYSDIAKARLEAAQKLIVQKIKKETDSQEYKTLELVLKRMGKCEKTERKAFVPLLIQIQELLRFKIIEEKDWYAAKKYHQFKQNVDEWGLSAALPF